MIQFKLRRIKITRASLERQVTTEKEIVPQDELRLTKIELQRKPKSEMINISGYAMLPR